MSRTYRAARTRYHVDGKAISRSRIRGLERKIFGEVVKLPRTYSFPHALQDQLQAVSPFLFDAYDLQDEGYAHG